jgi:lipoyl(octanoyl) transferase
VDKQKVIFKDLGIIEYKAAWDYQEELLQQNVKIKADIGNSPTQNSKLKTQNYFLLCEHPPVYTLGKSH